MNGMKDINYGGNSTKTVRKSLICRSVFLFLKVKKQENLNSINDLKPYA